MAGTAALALVIAIASVRFHANAIEQDVESRVQLALAEAGIGQGTLLQRKAGRRLGGASAMGADGRDLLLLGEVDSVADILRAEEVVRSVRGVRVVRNRLVVSAPPSPTALQVEIVGQGRTVTLRGAVGHIQDEVELLAAAGRLYGSEHVIDKLEVVDGEVSPLLVRGALAVLPWVHELGDARAESDEVGVSLQGVLPSPHTSGSVRIALIDRLPSGHGIDLELVAAPVPAPLDAQGCVEALNHILSTENILFESGDDGVDPISGPLLARLAGVLARCEAARLQVGGHTDLEGSEDANLELSNRRARAVRQALIDKGIDGGRLVAIGFGESVPIAENDTPEGRSANRRIVFERLEGAP